MTNGRLPMTVGLMLLSTANLHAQDRAVAVPGMRVLLENARVRVQHHDVGVGETVPMHSHPAYVAYVLAPYKARLKAKDGTERLVDRRPGDAFWGEPTTHTVENLGDVPIHNLIVELKDAPAEATGACAWPASLDAMVAAPGSHRVALENERVRLLDVTVAAGAREAVHAHCRPGVMYVMQAGAYRLYDGEGDTIQERAVAPPASAYPWTTWMEPQGPHALQNLDSRPVRLLQVELKRWPATPPSAPTPSAPSRP